MIVYRILFSIVLAFFCNVVVIVEAFTTPTHIISSIHHTTTSTQHNAGFMDDLSKFFDGLGGGSDNNDEQNDIAEVDGVYTGSKRIITIPSKSMKAGGLRLYCNLYLMGLQNTPEEGCWKASKADDSEVNLRYKDLSGSIIIRFTDGGITVDRLGSSPSNKYLMHESIILNGYSIHIDFTLYISNSIQKSIYTLIISPSLNSFFVQPGFDTMTWSTCQ